MEHIKKILLSSFFLISLGFFSAFPVYAYTSGPVEPFSFNVSVGVAPGTVRLVWYDDGTIEKFNLLYGTSADKFTSGIVDMAHGAKQTNEFIVRQLTPGQIYYFKLLGMKGGGDVESGPIAAKAAIDFNTQNKATYYSQVKNYEMPYLFSLSYGATSGSVNVTWFDNDSADKYHIVYGLNPNNYSYGFHDMPYKENMSNTFSVNYLTPGRTYYIALVAERNGQTVLWSQPLSITVR